MALFSVTPNYPKPPHFHYFVSIDRDFKFDDMLIVASDSPWMANYIWKGQGQVTQTI